MSPSSPPAVPFSRVILKCKKTNDYYNGKYYNILYTNKKNIEFKTETQT
jgi:hypothetical protein